VVVFPKHVFQAGEKFKIKEFQTAPSIPCSRRHPKILWIDDTEIVVTESQNSAQLRGTFSRKKLSATSANWAQVS
jgi:hypothetical protein